MIRSTLHTHWWILALRGLLAVMFGMATFLLPAFSLVILITLFAGYCLFDGILTLWSAARIHRDESRWWSLVVEGAISILAGVAAMVWPGLTSLVLLYLIAFWAIATGVFEIITAIRLRRELTGEWVMVLGGLLSVLLGVFLIVQPRTGALLVTWWISAYAFGFGIVLAVLAWRLRKQQTPPRNWPGTAGPAMG
ncbi:HdeD family acid-resistance protein [Solirubrum puertoriconensis]|uniref:HdeD family acid-resistance protein n=1 Tax=Solirubrum puertoriconensis TaxID=1751427 RepID=A0A9X0L5N4_SOLP1|nr:HdeD family acid-resistance protein [Solirubrum puertoriconensis]KUG08899.1 hypothetical protein ASU33_12315 [Solirubrum puertoriconensis]